MAVATDEITQLYVSYARGLDARNFRRARGIFAPDATIEGTFAAGPLDEYFPHVEARIGEYAVTMHHVGTTDIQVADDGLNAHVDSYTVAYHDSPVGGGRPWTMAVCYSDELERRGDRWLVVHRRVKKFWERWSD
jgi:hypothetical protein